MTYFLFYSIIKYNKKKRNLEVGERMDKGLPNNIDAEKALIGSMFWSKASLQKGCEEV